MKEVLLSDIEIQHILNLLQERDDEGSYYGQKKHYYSRTQRLIDLFGLLLYREKNVNGSIQTKHKRERK